jgi:hypothetical protein
METHEINFEGIEFEVQGEYEKSEEETNSKGGWKSYQIFHNGDDMQPYLSDWAINRINEQIVDENY